MLRALTVSSGDKWSWGGSLRLYAAQRMSRDFLSVSSILQAEKSAAAAASCGKVNDGSVQEHVAILTV
jgi:hypothetical protein